ncbi:MAG: hypothetical protein WD342_09390 [Verrucomicrobiales bacterium]
MIDPPSIRIALRFFFLSVLLAGVPAVTSHGQIEEPDPFIEIGAKQGDDALEQDDENGDARATDDGKTGEPAPLSAQISQHILKLADAERRKRLKFMNVVIDDVARLCELGGEQRERLELAAKGASERSMKDWHEQAERYFRTRLDGADTDAVKEMLEGMGNVSFGGNRSEEESETLDLWKDTLKVVLSDEQIARYEEVLDQRQLDRIEAFSRMSLTTIDSHLRLTPEQREKLGEIVHEAATLYLEDVQRYWGDHFERKMLMSLANASDQDDLREILTEEQYKRFKDATSSFDHFWDQKRKEKKDRVKAARRGNERSDDEAAAKEAPANKAEES